MPKTLPVRQKTRTKCSVCSTPFTPSFVSSGVCPGCTDVFPEDMYPTDQELSQEFHLLTSEGRVQAVFDSEEIEYNEYGK
jgi:hypothetical protein